MQYKGHGTSFGRSQNLKSFLDEHKNKKYTKYFKEFKLLP